MTLIELAGALSSGCHSLLLVKRKKMSFAFLCHFSKKILNGDSFDVSARFSYLVVILGKMIIRRMNSYVLL